MIDISEKVKQVIKQDEHVIYFCNAVIGKIDKQLIRFLIGFVLLTVFFTIPLV